MSWDSAAERLPRRRLGGSAAAAPLRPPRLPGRPTSARQRRHLDTGWAGRAATGHREGHGMRCACAGRRGSRRLRRGARLPGAARAKEVPRRGACACPGQPAGSGISPDTCPCPPAWTPYSRPLLNPGAWTHTEHTTFPQTSQRVHLGFALPGPGSPGKMFICVTKPAGLGRITSSSWRP